MKLSKKFLENYLDLKNKDFTEIAEKMVFLGNEYNEVSKLSPAKGLVIGQIISVEKHPDSSKLSICKVDIGTVEQIVCGAPNVAENQKVVVAPVGAMLAEDFKIKKVKLAGVSSNGMICSLVELGLDKKFLQKKDSEEIMVLDDSAPVGEDAIKFLGFDDEVIDFDLTPNRADLLSVLGMAYEIGALYEQKVEYPMISFLESKTNINDKYTLKVKTDNCLLYLAKLVENVQIKESPKFLKNYLLASGIRPINNVVDISNYVMLETGQPIHFFDGDIIKKIGVRMGRNEELQTLDEQFRQIDKEDIVITDNDKPIALAGVMGGYHSEVTMDTKNIIIESAIFNPINIRKTSKKTLRSEASIRFEKGVAKERTFLAIKRACHLLEKYANGKVATGMLQHDQIPNVEKTIDIDLDHINSVLGMNLSEQAVLKVFDRLNLPYAVNNKISVMIPARRLDLNIPEDLIEEVGRLIGYDQIKSQLPVVEIKSGQINETERYLKKIRNFLIGKGFNQNISYSLISEDETAMFNNYSAIKLQEPISKEREYLRTSLVPSLLKNYQYNKARSIDNVAIFETGAIYFQEETYQEQEHLAILISGYFLENKWNKNELLSDFYLLKGLLESLLDYLGFANRYQLLEKQFNNMHPYRSVEVLIDNKVIGFMGQLHPKVVKDVYVLEINLHQLMNFEIKPIKYKEPIKYPSVKKDVAFIVNNEINSFDIEKVIKKVGSRKLANIAVFDVYKINDQQKSIAYSLTFRDESKTLSDEEVMVVFNKIIVEVEKQLDAKLRNE